MDETRGRPLIPRAVQLVIDDVGRRMGIKARGPMYRRPPVIDRLMTVDDYARIADIGEAVGMHWANLLDHDPAGNPQVAARWIDYLRSVDREPGFMLARDTEQCWSQWVFHTYAELQPAGERWMIDLSGVPERAWDEGYAKTLSLAIPLDAGDHVSSFGSKAFTAIGYEERHGAARLVLRPNSRQGGEVRWTFGDRQLVV